jgi:hypothetical protein
VSVGVIHPDCRQAGAKAQRFGMSNYELRISNGGGEEIQKSERATMRQALLIKEFVVIDCSDAPDESL